MPIGQYGVLKGRAVGARPGAEVDASHYHIHVEAAGTAFRVAISVRSRTSEPAATDLLSLIDRDVRHPVTAALPSLPDGFVPVASRPGGLALDYIRSGLFDRRDLRQLAAELPGPANDLNEAIDAEVRGAIANPDVRLYAYGARWGPEPGRPDQVFGFEPGNGIHDVHMNQGNDRRHVRDNGTWQDGALLIHSPADARWTAIFLAFRSQTWQTDERGVAVGADRTDHASGRGAMVEIVAAVVNPIGPDLAAETVTLLNTAAMPVDVTGWAIVDREHRAQRLSGTLAPGQRRVVALGADVRLGNGGGSIALVDQTGREVHRVSYTRRQAEQPGRTIVFGRGPT